MAPMEIWLRLSGVRGLKGEQRNSIANFLIHQPQTGKLELAQAGLTEEQRYAFLHYSSSVIAETYAWLENPGHHFITCDHMHYPERLKQIANSPSCLFVQGDPGILATPQIAVVGSRDCSVYGRHWGTYFTQTLAQNGLTVTSGLALGIDGIAHRAALEASGKTLAVLGSGLNHIYPRRHLGLAKEIVSSGGAIVSEFPLATRPHAHNFPRRNRIISGLSLGVLVVEATFRSGSLVTARLALEQDRDVYAIPGAIGNPGSEGPHWLIQQGALLTAHPDAILEQLQSDLAWLPSVTEASIYSQGEDNTPLPFADVLANVGDEVTPVDVVAERAGQPVPVIVAKLLELELAGWIAAVPGGYVRLRRASHVRRTHVLI
ncbi:DNA-protecting protein DprA [Erwinia sp. P6884]|uniref:DNA-protecting protein DprA n=1 Tax=Erwinia sp. P6884 TaxID=3141450 RepID=UPI003185477C